MDDRRPCRHVYAALIYAEWQSPNLDRQPVNERVYRRCRAGDRRLAVESTGLCRDHMAELRAAILTG